MSFHFTQICAFLTYSFRFMGYYSCFYSVQKYILFQYARVLRKLFFLHFQFLHRALHHLFQLVGGYAKRLIDVAQRPFYNGFVFIITPSSVLGLPPNSCEVVVAGFLWRAIPSDIAPP